MYVYILKNIRQTCLEVGGNYVLVTAREGAKESSQFLQGRRVLFVQDVVPDAGYPIVFGKLNTHTG